ncbi:DUF2553 family protein [Thermoflavimicrobium dichotomicum]|uniref:DUF2553 domain-containing protein n=1 Tax=Thermoflavimicrobium dichotomicum TaxID=46223 RepID=A0A1I3JKR0_9BACL|nr:DUF2553 family protein [Thermoflavimicrobium dichotomicum]SFI60710.1 Protein of unknown function [Thermoflavimicrobium dichotomicum]
MKTKDITTKVVGKFQNGKLFLFYQNRLIGKVQLDQEQFLLNEGFKVDGDRIYAMIKENEGHQPYISHYVDNCDLGWC